MRYWLPMNWLVHRIDEDVVASLNGLRRVRTTGPHGSQFASMLTAIYAPRPTWLKLVAPLIATTLPIIFIDEPLKTYWMVGDLGLVLLFFGFYFYRFALIRQNWIDERVTDEFGSFSPPSDDTYKTPLD